MTKFQSVEASKVLSPEDHERIEAKLHRIGKTSAKDLTEDQRTTVLSE